MYRTDFWTLWEKARWDVSREQHRNMYIIYSETDHQPRLDAWDKCLDLVHWEDPEGAGRETLCIIRSFCSDWLERKFFPVRWELWKSFCYCSSDSFLSSREFSFMQVQVIIQLQFQGSRLPSVHSTFHSVTLYSGNSGCCSTLCLLSFSLPLNKFVVLCLDSHSALWSRKWSLSSNLGKLCAIW